MDKLKIMTIFGTRPEIIRLSEIIKKCDVYFQQILVHTGQNWDYTLNQIFFDELGLRQPDIFLEASRNDLGETIGSIIARSFQVMKEQKPDAVLILGDTNSALSAIAAKRLKIPIFHMEAGNRCFDENLPEETNRKIVDHIADINLCYSEHARRYLNLEGTAKERTYVVGSPMAEVLSVNWEKIKESKILKSLDLEPEKYILLSAHREENIDDEKNFMELMNTINSLAEIYQIPIIFSVHPRSRKFIERRNFQFHPLVKSLQPFGFFDYNCLQIHAFCVVSDSGTLPEESTYFSVKNMPFSAISIRTSTERPEALDKGNLIIGGINRKQILQAVELAILMKKNKDFGVVVPDYVEEIVSTKVVKLIQSYTGIVNKMVWRKEVE